MLIRKKVEIISCDYTIGELYTQYKEGKIVILSKWLQRLLRKSKWEQNKWRSVREYNDSFFNGEGNLQPFYIVPIDVLLSEVESDMEYITKDLSLKAYKEIVKSLKDAKKNGAKDVLLDGQNRLVVSLVPFFDSKMGIEESKTKKVKNKITGLTEEVVTTKFIDYTDYPNGFVFIGDDGVEKTLNNFQYKDLTEEQQNAFWNTEVDIKVCEKGKLSDIVKSLVNLNKNNSWSSIEHALIECLPLPYVINDMIFENPTSHSLFGNLDNIKGNVKDMDGNYALEVKGHGRFLTELTYYTVKGGKGGFGSDSSSCDLLRSSDVNDDGLNAFEDRVSKFLDFVAINYDCMVSDNLYLPVPQRPFTREFLRTLYLTLEIMTNSKNNYHSRSPMKLAKGYKTFLLPKNFIDDVLEWHMGKKNAQATPEDFNGQKPKDGTYAASTISLAKEAVDNRSEFILEFLTSKKEVWQNGNYFDESVKYAKQSEAVRQKSGGKDFWTGRKRTRRDNTEIEHLLAVNGPNKGTDNPNNLVMSTKRPNKLKTNKV